MIRTRRRRVDGERLTRLCAGGVALAERGVDPAHAQQAARGVGVAPAQARPVTAQRLGEQGPRLPRPSACQVEHARTPEGVGGSGVHVAEQATAHPQRLAQGAPGRLGVAPRQVEQAQPVQPAGDVVLLGRVPNSRCQRNTVIRNLQSYQPWGKKKSTITRVASRLPLAAPPAAARGRRGGQA